MICPATAELLDSKMDESSQLFPLFGLMAEPFRGPLTSNHLHFLYDGAAVEVSCSPL